MMEMLAPRAVQARLKFAGPPLPMYSIVLVFHGSTISKNPDGKENGAPKRPVLYQLYGLLLTILAPPSLVDGEGAIQVQWLTVILRGCAAGRFGIAISNTPLLPLAVTDSPSTVSGRLK